MESTYTDNSRSELRGSGKEGKPEAGLEGRLIRAVMNYEPRQSQDNVLKNTECYDGNGDTCNDNVAAECKYMSPKKKSRTEMRRRAGSGSTKLRDVKPVRAACKIPLMGARTWGWIPPLSKFIAVHACRLEERALFLSSNCHR